MKYSGVLTRTEHDLRTVDRQPFEVVAARLITAMLAPLRVEGMQLDGGRFAAQAFDDPPDLVVAQGDVGTDEFLTSQ